MAVKKALVPLEYQNTIMGSPIPPKALYGQATSNDAVTIEAWRDTWISQTRANHAIHGPFKEKSLAKLYQKHLHQPVILVGSGPSLKKNAEQLKNNKSIPVVSCLHNFHYLEDLGVKVDYYVSLDAGPLTIEEVSEGGDTSVDYWAKSKGKTLICYVGTHPNLLAKWQGDIYFYNCPVPDNQIRDEIEKIEKFKVMVSSGGNVLGACLYIAKAFLGCHTTIFMGADFSFSYDEKFHGWDSKYDKSLGHYIKMTDIYGIKVKTWQSYANFKSWFDWVAQSVPGEYINCTEGGTFGAYDAGNIVHIKQMDLEDCLKAFNMSEHMRDQVENQETDKISILF